MKIDIQTLVIVIGFTHLMQVLVFFHQYKVNNAYKGPGWWLLWSAVEIIGFGAMLFRNIPSILPMIIIIQNSMIVSGTVFLYIGIRRFLDKPIKLNLILPVVTVFMIGLLYFLFFENKIQIRSAIINVTLATISFFTAASLLANKIRSITASARFNAVIFLLHGGIFVFNTFIVLTGSPVENVFTPALFNIIPYFDALIVSLLWTFGLIIMLNQRLNAGMSEANEDLQLIFNTSPDAAIITRLADGMIVDMNEGYCTITGYTREEMAGKSSIEINIWKNIADRHEVVRLLKEKGYCTNFEARFLMKDGTEIIGLMSAKIISLQGVPHIISISRDITERKRMEESLHESELKLRSVVDATPFPVAIVDLEDDKINYWSQSAMALFGHTAPTTDEWYQMAYPDPVYRQKVVECWKPALEMAKQSGQTVNTGEYRVACHDGSMRICELYATFLADTLIVTFNDITERKTAEIRLEKEKVWSELIIQAAPDIIIGMGENSRIILFNRFAEELTGYHASEVMGKEWIGLFIPPELKEQLYEVWREVVKNSAIARHHENEILLKSGEKRIIQWDNTLLTENGEFRMVLSIGQDITERKKSEERLVQSERKFRETVVNLDEGYYSVMLNGVLLEHNQAFNRLLGFDIEKDLKGIHLPDFWLYPEKRGEYVGILTSAGSISNYQIEVKTITGKIITVLASAHLVKDSENHPVWIEGVFLDITPRIMAEQKIRKANRIYAVISQINQAIVHLRDKEEVFREVCRIAVETGKFRMAWIGLVDEHAGRLDPAAFAGVEEGYLSDIQQISIKDIPEGNGPTGTAVREGKHVFCNDIENDPQLAVWRDEALKRGYRSSIALPVNVFGNVIGAFTLYSETPSFFDLEEITMLVEVTNDIGFALEVIEAEEKRRHAEEELISHHTLLTALINSVQDTIIFSLDKNYCYTAFNEAHRREMKKIWNADIVIGTSLVECMHIQALRESAKQSINRSLNGEAFSEIQYQPEQDVYYEFSWNPIREANEVVGITVLIRDITNNKKAEKERQLFSNVLEQSLDEIYIFDLQSLRFVTVNKGAIINIGYSIEELRSMTPLDLKPGFSEAQFKELIRPLVEGEHQTIQFSTFHRRKDGSTYPVDVHLSINQQEKLFVAIILDMTTARQKEEELLLSAEKFKNVFEHAAVGKSLTSPDGIVQVNKAFCSMIGYSFEELSAIKWQELTHPDDIKRDSDIVDSLLRGENDQVRWVKRYLHKDGSIVWADISSVLQRDLQGQPLYFITTISDITSQMLTQEKLRETNDEIKHLNETLEQRVIQRTAQLEASNQELEAFTYSVSHDLRAPLRHISGYVDLLAQRCHSSLTEQGIHYLDTIAGSANQMGTLIDDLLEFSRTGRQEMQETGVDMNNLLQEVMEAMKDEYRGRRIEWVVARLPVVFADHALLRLVWVNLLSNAIKFTRPRKSARIEIGFHRDKKELVFFVRDNGAGFDMQYAHKLFGVFQRLHSAEEFEGTGIGLANVRRIITRHGGRTWAEARLDKGATFYFTLSEVEVTGTNSKI